ncbi:hypothetical protein C5167_025486, partial [Papaver somniferum]
ALIFAGENLCPSSSSYLLRSSRKRVPPHRYQNTLFGCTTLEINDKTNSGSAGGGCSTKSVGGGSGVNAPVLSGDQVETSGGNEGHSIDILGPRKLKRQVQNKISAAKARKKVIQYKEETEKKIKDLQEEKSSLTDQVSILTDEAARWKQLALEANLIYHTDGFPMADSPTCQLCDCFGHTAKNCLHHLVFPCEKEYNVVPNEDDNSTSATSTSDTVKHQSLSWEEDELATLLQQPTIGEDFISRCSLFELSADSFNF